MAVFFSLATSTSSTKSAMIIISIMLAFAKFDFSAGKSLLKYEGFINCGQSTTPFTGDVYTGYPAASPLPTSLSTWFTSPCAPEVTKAPPKKDDVTAHPESNNCGEITDWVYEDGLCGAPDPETYLATHKARYTCENRCGAVPEFNSTGQHEECACDDSCAAHGDCCDDMPVVCPHIYARGGERFAHMLRASSTCDSGSYRVFRHCKAHDGDQSQPWVSVDLTWIDISHGGSLGMMPCEPRTLQKLTHLNSLNDYKVIDLPLGVIFDDLNTFMACRSSRSKPRFVPKKVFLGCSETANISSGGYPPSASQVLPWCFPSARADVETRFHRNCNRKRTLACHCRNNLVEVDAHKACSGSAPVEIESSLVNSFSTVGKGIEKKDALLSGGKGTGIRDAAVPFRCTLPRNLFHQTQKLELGIGLKINVMLTVLPIAAADSAARGGEESTGYTTVSLVEEEPSASYVVELTNTLERRLRCPSHGSLLSACRLESCAGGGAAILSASPNSPWRYGGLSCILAVRAVVVFPGERLTDPSPRPVPTCTCVRVLSAVSGLGLWDTRLVTRGNDRCVFDMETLSPDKTAAAEPPPLPEMSEVVPRPAPSIGVTYRPSLKDRIQRRLVETAPLICEDETSHTIIDVCFYSAHDIAAGELARWACVRLSIGSNVDRLAFSPLITIVLIACVLMSFSIF